MPTHAAPPAPMEAAAEAEERRREKEEEDARKKEESEKKMQAALEKAQEERNRVAFKQMLLERSVTPGGVWEKELPKFCFDERYSTLIKDPSARKAAFGSFTRADVIKYKEEEKKAAQERKAAALEVARELMDKAKLSANSTLDSFWLAVADDGRLAGVEKTDKKLVQLWHLKIEPIRAEAREHTMKLKEAFLAALEKDHTVTESSSWSKYKSKLESGRFEEEQEQEGGGLGMEEKEAVFREYVKGLMAAKEGKRGDDVAGHRNASAGAGAGGTEKGPEKGNRVLCFPDNVDMQQFLRALHAASPALGQ